MPLIHLITSIKAPIQVVFDLSRSIDFHQESVSKTREKAVAGRTSGLIELGETVTWEAFHLGVKQQLTTKITAMVQNRPLSDLISHPECSNLCTSILISSHPECLNWRPSILSSQAQKTQGASLSVSKGAMRFTQCTSSNVSKGAKSGYYFVDEMVKGVFKSIKHEHLFYEEKDCVVSLQSTRSDLTVMVDLFHFEAPLGILGKLANVLFLKRYMTHFLNVRNAAIKEAAERI